MELYHLHLKGINDHFWKPRKEIVVTDKFNNRLAKKINNFSTATDETRIEELYNIHNLVLNANGYYCFDKTNLDDLIDCYLHMKDFNPELNKYVLELLRKSREIISNASMFKREMAMEEYRKDHNPSLPSRMHCIYALEEKDIPIWSQKLVDGDLEVFRIETLEEPFKTSEQLIPVEHLSYKDYYDASYNYWNPHKADINCEYLVKGKVKVKEKVDEIKRK